MPRQLILLCHGATAAQRRGAFPDSNEPLMEGQMIPSLAVLDIVLSAPERRAEQTAGLIAGDFARVHELRDCDFGSWKGQDLKTIAQADPEGTARWLADPAAAPHGGETLNALYARVRAWLSGQAPSRSTLAVTHATVIRMAVICVLDAPIQSFWRIDVEPLSLVNLRHNGVTWTIRSISPAT